MVKIKKTKTGSRLGSRLKGKRAVSEWVSFVLLTAFMVVLGTVVYFWIVNYVTDSGQNIKRIVYNYDLCDYISVSIDEVCLNSQSLYINVTNRNTLRVNAFVLTVFSQNDILSIENNLTIKPGKQKRIELSLNMTNASMLQVTPIMFKEDMKIICSDKKVSKSIDSC